eukprot:CAMPEP_0204631632 /NCGR_PEP_ID=MMETSP0717-20131115/23093_1 /ASSEMBLY_ACC=CAM_ASM_000666 /TAXON_ID=230516 /ORGANISM="Chaetoceros curvisetus" /LENGTH=306 /DNA_ID=CAMNT_0051649237 /DNA_START=815 /DNA_END=1735 /DNA_ORIENTATION=+
MAPDIESSNSFRALKDKIDIRSDRSSRSRQNRSKSIKISELRRKILLDPFQDDEKMYMEEDEYLFKQKRGYMSIFFSLVQTCILLIMMLQLGIASFDINPMIGPTPDALDDWGGKNARKIIDDGEYLRLITPVFLHAGIIHLFGNILVQLDVGASFEREWGSLIWTIIYLTSGAGGSIFSVCFKPDDISVGSSGAVMGLFGGKLGEIFCRACESRETVQGRIGHEVRMEQLSISLCSILMVMAFSFVPFVDWAAHIGGVISGFAIALVCFAPRIKTKAFAVFWFCVGLVFNFVMYFVLVSYMLTEV